MDGDECWHPSKNTESFLAWWEGNANKDKIHNDWFHNSFLSLVFLSGPTFEGVVRRSIKDRCQMLLRGSWAKRWRGGSRQAVHAGGWHGSANSWRALSRRTRGTLLDPLVAFPSGCSQIFWTWRFYLTLTQSMQMRPSCEPVMSPKNPLSSALIVVIASAPSGIGIDTARSIMTSLKWGTFLGDAATALQIYRYFLIQLRRWRPFNSCWPET